MNWTIGAMLLGFGLGKLCVRAGLSLTETVVTSVLIYAGIRLIAL